MRPSRGPIAGRRSTGVKRVALALAVATATVGSLVTVAATPAVAVAGQELFHENFTGPTTTAPVTPIGSGLPCLTAGQTPQVGSVAGCTFSPPDNPGALRFTNAV